MVSSASLPHLIASNSFGSGHLHPCAGSLTHAINDLSSSQFPPPLSLSRQNSLPMCAVKNELHRIDICKISLPPLITPFSSFKLDSQALEQMDYSQGPAGLFFKAHKKTSADKKGFASVVQTPSGRQFALVHRMTMKQAQAFEKETGLDIPFECIRHIELGKGSEGKVRLALDITSNQWCAVKKMTNSASARREIENFKHVKGIPNLIQFIDSAEIYYKFDSIKKAQTPQATQHYLFMTLAPGKNGLTAAADRRSKGKVDVQLIKWAKDYAQLVASLHAKNLAHQDIKPSNFVHSKEGIQLVDFGFVTDQENAEGYGTNGYVPPHPSYIQAGTASKEPLKSKDQDNFGLGMTFLCLKHGMAAYQLAESTLESPLELHLKETKTGFNHTVPVLFKEVHSLGIQNAARFDQNSFDGIVAGLLDTNPSQRLTADEACTRLKNLLQQMQETA